MIGFHDVRFPEDVSWGSRGGPQFKTQVFISHHGYEKRNIDWQQPMMAFDVAYGIRTDVQMMKVINFFNARQGRAYGFRYKNWGAYKMSGQIAVGDGTNKRLPIHRVYTQGGATFKKRLWKIVKGSVTEVLLGGVSKTEGVDFNIDYNSGEIVFNTAPGNGVSINVTNLEYDEPVRFDVDSVQSVIDAYNNNNLKNLPLVGVRSTFTAGTVFAPNEDPAETDPFWDDTVLVLNFDDIANLLTTVDSSSLAAAVTFNGTATLDKTAFQHGEGSFSPGSDGHLSLSGTPYALGELPFTLEVFAQQPTIGEAVQHLISRSDPSTNNRSYELRYVLASNRLQFAISTNGSSETILFSYPWTALADAFDYISVDRMLNGWWVLRINGEVVQSVRDFSTVYTPSAVLTVGRKQTLAAGEGAFQGLMDSVRLTLGRTRHDDFSKVDIPGPYLV